MSRARRTGRPLCLALLDLDHFKAFNDTHGHQAGDAHLRRTAAAWRRELRTIDVLARYGGEEFGILLPECDLDEAQRGARPRPHRDAERRDGLGGRRPLRRPRDGGLARRPRRRGDVPREARRPQRDRPRLSHAVALR